MKKWSRALFALMLDVSAQNPWILHVVNCTEKDPSYSLLSFRREIVNTAFFKYWHYGVSKRRMSWVSVSHVPDDFRYDQIKHHQVPAEKQVLCNVCKKNSGKMCLKFKMQRESQ